MLSGFVIGDRGLAGAGDTHLLWMSAHATLGDYLIVGASAVGQFHLKHELPRDDAFVIRSSGPWLAAAVSDGVGSRPLSRFGATYVAEALSALLLRATSGPDQASPAQRGNESTAADSAEWVPPELPDEVEFDPTIAKSRRRGRIPSIDGLRKDIAAQTKHNPKNYVSNTVERAASTGWFLAPALASNQSAVQFPPGCGSMAGDPENLPETDRTHARKPLDLSAIMRQSFAKTHLGLREHASRVGLELSELGCTALGLLLNTETGQCIAGQVGDGALLGLTARGRIRELVEAPDTGDPQAVFTINRPTFEDHLAIRIVDASDDDPLVAYYAMTDGLSSDILYSPNARDLERWGQAVDHNLRISSTAAQASAGVLNWLARYQVKGSWDDRTLVVVTQRKRNDGYR